MMAMLLAHLKRISEKNRETHISDCVMGIPSYFTDLQRRAYLNAAEIASLKPLRLMHDCTATALGYGIYKNDLSGARPTNVVFVDIGHCDTQIAVAAFELGQMKILSHAFDRDLGGRDFDEVLFRHFAVQSKERYHIDVYSNGRASKRLREACEKLKKVLSANPEAPLHIECLMDEKDIHSVELVGSGSRILAIKRILASLFNREPSRTLNASECAARGCALQCAMLSPIFRVRKYETSFWNYASLDINLYNKSFGLVRTGKLLQFDFSFINKGITKVQDSFPFSIGLSSGADAIYTLSNGVLFPKSHPFPSLKMLTLHRSNTFDIEVLYSDPKELPPDTSTKSAILWSVYDLVSLADVYDTGGWGFLNSRKWFFKEMLWIGPFQVSNSKQTKVKVKVQLNLHGFVTVDSASLLIEDSWDDSTVRSNSHLTSEKMEVDNVGSSDVAKVADDTYFAHSDASFTPALLHTYRSFATESE
ncbi:unnamed protein product [Ilex paraguariensis]|uniref:N-terminal Ras-GEF domain-containing protein n=1 Tax=Ilex paraguariensis TaxID=185542 RepID=A0ABC8V360_9AQUA